MISSHGAAASSKLTANDYKTLEKSYISRKIADAAGLYRVGSLDGRTLVGRTGGGDYSGMVYPYTGLGSGGIVGHRLRLDNPPIDVAGKEEHKYVTAAGTRNRLYPPPYDPALLLAMLADPTKPIIITEGEKKTLALYRMALETGNGAGQPASLSLGLAGVWSWLGTVGTRINANGQRVPEKGVIPDFDLIQWMGRPVTILFDVNAATNPSVKAARRSLAAELTHRGAKVWLADLPPRIGVNGCDDFLGLFGVAELEIVLKAARRHDWRDELMISDKGKALAVLANATTALRWSPEWHGALAWDEFAMQVVATRDAPWGPVKDWTDHEDRRTTEWLQRQGILVKVREAGQAIQTVARDRAFHPVRQYLETLKWDGIGRIDDWLTLYLGATAPADLTKADPTGAAAARWLDFTRAVGARWLISAVARVRKPGCKADCTLVLEGLQGIGKSSALKILAGEWYTDDVAELGSKDAPLGTRGKWICEFAELDSIAKATPSKIKAFISRAVDHFRLPYEARAGDFPRECVFAGTLNDAAYLRDETGGRRFWPVTCGRINLEALQRDRDQLWAEAVHRYEKGEAWWLNTVELIAAAEEEQSDRYDDDPWTGPIETWLPLQSDVSMADLLKGPCQKPIQYWTLADKQRVGRIMRRLKEWKRYRNRVGGGLEWRYRKS